jgi:hypothetical protein
MDGWRGGREAGKSAPPPSPPPADHEPKTGDCQLSSLDRRHLPARCLVCRTRTRAPGGLKVRHRACFRQPSAPVSSIS